MPYKLNRCACKLADKLEVKGSQGQWWVVCDNCGRHTRSTITRKEAVRKWNDGRIEMPAVK